MKLSRTRVKVCGITNLADALAAVYAGADALGFVFYPESPRCISQEMAKGIIMRLPPFVNTVGLFVNAPLTEVHQVAYETGISMIQLHGDESPDYCASIQWPTIKALSMREDIDINHEMEVYASVSAVLVDTHHPRLRGGTGEVFDWSLLPKKMTKPLILAGGLTSENVQQAIVATEPFAVDVSGGVEKQKGIKDALKLTKFIHQVIKTDNERAFSNE